MPDAGEALSGLRSPERQALPLSSLDNNGLMSNSKTKYP